MKVGFVWGFFSMLSVLARVSECVSPCLSPKQGCGRAIIAGNGDILPNAFCCARRLSRRKKQRPSFGTQLFGISVSIIEFRVNFDKFQGTNRRLTPIIGRNRYVSCFWIALPRIVKRAIFSTILIFVFIWLLGSREKVLFFEHSLCIWETRFDVSEHKTSANR